MHKLILHPARTHTYTHTHTTQLVYAVRLSALTVLAQQSRGAVLGSHRADDIVVVQHVQVLLCNCRCEVQAKGGGRQRLR
jgi:hypothetical protein